MEEQSPTRRVLIAVVEGRRQRGQAKTKMGRWCDGRCQEVGGEKLEEGCKDRDSWQKLLKKALAQKGLLCQL